MSEGLSKFHCTLSLSCSLSLSLILSLPISLSLYQSGHNNIWVLFFGSDPAPPPPEDKNEKKKPTRIRIKCAHTLRVCVSLRFACAKTVGATYPPPCVEPCRALIYRFALLRSVSACQPVLSNVRALRNTHRFRLELLPAICTSTVTLNTSTHRLRLTGNVVVIRRGLKI